MAILSKSSFESVQSIIETHCFDLAIVLQCLPDSIGFISFHLHWIPHVLTVELHKKRIGMRKLCCPSCMLQNEMIYIALWLVMSHDFSWIHYHVEWELFREITWSQSRDMISRRKIHFHDHMESARFPYCRQTPKWYQNEQRLFCDRNPKSVWISDLSSRKGGASEMICDSSRSLLDWHKSGFHILIQEHGMRRMQYPFYRVSHGVLASRPLTRMKQN
jgi:hypothetical protein